MSAAEAAAPLLDASDVEEIERDLRRFESAAGAVSLNPPVDPEAKRERKRRISIPADDVGPSETPALESSWLAMLHPVDLEELVEAAFTPERLAQVPEPTKEDDGIDVDIDLEEVPSVERQAAQSGEIGVPALPEAAVEAARTAKTAKAEPAPDPAATPPPTPRADSAPPPPPQSPPPPPKDAAGPPPVPLSVFTGETDQAAKVPEVGAPEDDKAGAPPPVPADVVETVGEDEADEEAFEGGGSTSVDDVQPLEFPDGVTPPPIPPSHPAAKASGEETAEAAGEAGTPEVTGEGGPPPTPASAEAAPGKPPTIPADAKGSPPPAPTASPPAVPAPPPSVPKKKRPKKFKKPWFEEFFDDDYLRTIPFMTPSYSVKEMGYIRSHLDLPDGAKLLDVGCGYGRLAIEFARAGYDVTGLDTSLPLMFLAAEASNEAEVEVNFMHRDMREMSFDAEFDGVYCVMTSFGYFDDDTNRDVVGRMYRALKPGGKLFIEVINRDFILNDLPSRVWWEGDDCVVMDEVEFNFLTSRIISKRSVVFSDGRSVNHDLSIRAYCLHELGRLLHNAGFRVSSVTGNINTDNRFFGQHSPYLIVISEKPK